MKKIDFSVPGWSDSARLPLKQSVLQQIQESPKEIVANTIKSLIKGTYSQSTIYILYGVEKSGNDYSAGAIFFYGEVYDFAAQTISGTTYFSLVQTTLETITFSDGSNKNVLIEQKFELTATDSGLPYTDAVRINRGTEEVVYQGTFSGGSFYQQNITVSNEFKNGVNTPTTHEIDYLNQHGQFDVRALKLVFTENISDYYIEANNSVEAYSSTEEVPLILGITKFGNNTVAIWCNRFGTLDYVSNFTVTIKRLIK